MQKAKKPLIIGVMRTKTDKQTGRKEGMERWEKISKSIYTRHLLEQK